MKKFFLIVVVYLILIVPACKTKQDALQPQSGINNPGKAINKDPSEYNAAPEPGLAEEENTIPPGDEEYLTKLALEKATLLCKKKDLLNSLKPAEKEKATAIENITKQIDELELVIKKVTTVRELNDFFNAKFNEFFEKCDKE